MSGRSPGAFVGREPELAAIEDILDTTGRGRGQVLILAGQAGIGKTRLLHEAIDRARSRNMAVAWAGCSPDPVAPPLWPWVQLLDALGRSGALAGASHADPAVGPRGDPELARREQFARVVRELHAAAAQRPAVLVIDDLHWADPASLRLLGFLGPTLPGAPLSVLIAHRDDEVGTALGDLLPRLAPHGRRVGLDGLAADDVAELALVETGQRVTDRGAAALRRHTAGNPLFLRELVTQMARDGELARIGRPYGTVPLPDGVRAVLERQLSRTSDGCQRLLAGASVVGDAFDLELVGTVLEAEATTLLADVDEAVAARMAVPIGPGRLAFVHPLIRETAHGRLPSAQRMRLHERAGRALEAVRDAGGTVDPALLAHHFVEAAPIGAAAEALRYARAAGAHAMAVLAYEDAVLLYGYARDVLALRPADPDEAEVLLCLADAHQAVGDRDEARRTYDQAAVVARRAGRVDLLARAALGMGSGAGGFEVPLFDTHQLALLEEAAAALGDEPSALRVWVDARRSVAMTHTDTVDRRLALSGRALAMAREVGDPAALGAALAAHCDAIAGPTHVDARQHAAQEIVAVAVRLEDRGLELLGRRLLVLARMERGDVVAALAEVDRYAAVADRLGQPLYAWYPPLWRGARALMEGRIADAERHRAEAAAIGTRAQSGNAELLVWSQEWATREARGDHAGARALMRQVVGLSGMPEVQVRVAVTYGMAACGGVAEARARLDGLTAGEIDSMVIDAEWLTGMFFLGATIAVLGRHPLAAAVYDRLLPYADVWAIDGIWAAAHGPAHRFLAPLAALLDRPADARAHTDAALAAAQRAGASLLVAETHLAAGRALRDQDHLAAARDLFASLGLAARRDEAAAALEAGEGPVAPVGRGKGRHRNAEVHRDPVPASAMRLQGGVWELTFAGRQVGLRDAKALHDIARLVAQPGTEIHVLDLATPVRGGRHPPGAAEIGSQPGDLGEVLDATARRAYRQRLDDLEDDLVEAERFGDTERAARARAEREHLAQELAAAVGLGGRVRRTGDPAERARSAVTRRIRAMVVRIGDVHPELGRHLRHAVRTGTYCAYEPDDDVTWEIEILTS